MRDCPIHPKPPTPTLATKTTGTKPGRKKNTMTTTNSVADVDQLTLIEVKPHTDAHEVSLEILNDCREPSAALDPAAARQLAQLLLDAAEAAEKPITDAPNVTRLDTKQCQTPGCTGRTSTKYTQCNACAAADVF